MTSKARGHTEPDWGFEWPPKQRIVPSEIVELEKSSGQKSSVESQQQAPDSPPLEFNTRSPLPLPLPVKLPEPHAAVAPAAHPQATPVPTKGIPREELPAEVQEELRGLDADFWGPIALDNYLKRGWIMPTAIVVLALVAVIEGVFLLWGRSEEPYVVKEFAPPPTSPAQSTPGQQLPRPSVPPIATSPTPSSKVPQASANRTSAANDVAGGRSGVQPRQTLTAPTAQPARPAPAVAPSNPSVRAPGWVTISAPIELNVSEKGSLLGTTRGPRILLAPGDHVLQLESAAFGYRENQLVRIHAGKETTLALPLPQGIVHVNATPWADVSIDGKSFGQTPIGNLKLTIGSHDVVFRHPQLGEKTVSALVKVGTPTRVSADLTQR